MLRPLAYGLNATKPNKLLHFDFGNMGIGEKGTSTSWFLSIILVGTSGPHPAKKLMLR